MTRLMEELMLTLLALILAGALVVLYAVILGLLLGWPGLAIGFLMPEILRYVGQRPNTSPQRKRRLFAIAILCFSDLLATNRLNVDAPTGEFCCEADILAAAADCERLLVLSNFDSCFVLSLVKIN
jgi:hypothetical protein